MAERRHHSIDEVMRQLEAAAADTRRLRRQLELASGRLDLRRAARRPGAGPDRRPPPVPAGDNDESQNA